MTQIAENIKKIHQEIEIFAEQAKRDPNHIQLLCVSKTKPLDLIIEAYKNGERHFGESYAVEACAKIDSLKEQGYNDIIWHFIGPLQKNKTKIIAEHFDIVESVDRPIIANRLNAQRPTNLPKLKVLIEVNISNESQKSGCAISKIEEIVNTILQCDNLELKGFMGIAKNTDDTEEIIRNFKLLKSIYLNYKKEISSIDTLSMGMTNDLKQAIDCGSNEVRIGTAIFGERVYTNVSPKIAFIGGGNMSSCIFNSITKELNANNIIVSGPHLEKLEHFANAKAHITNSNIEAIKNADVVFLGVKPQILGEVLNEIASSDLNIQNKLIISMAAGYKLSSIQKILKTNKLVRIMPNTPAKLGLGVTAVCFLNEVPQEDRNLTLNLLKNMGELVVGSETQLNVIGAICGCGPAFVYRFMEALIAEAINNGIDKKEARTMVEQTVKGSVAMCINNADSSIASLREAVTSKGGTTFAGLSKMTEANFEGMMSKTIKAALDRTAEFENMF